MKRIQCRTATICCPAAQQSASHLSSCQSIPGLPKGCMQTRPDTSSRLCLPAHPGHHLNFLGGGGGDGRPPPLFRSRASAKRNSQSVSPVQSSQYLPGWTVVGRESATPNCPRKDVFSGPNIITIVLSHACSSCPSCRTISAQKSGDAN